MEISIVGLAYPGLLSMIGLYIGNAIIIRAQKVSAGLVPPMSIEGQVIWYSLGVVLAIGTIVGLTKRMKDLIKEKKDLDSVHHNYSSLEEIDDLIHNKAREHHNLDNLLSQLIKEKNNLICKRDFILLSIDTLKEKITLAKDTFLEACSHIINEGVENNLNAYNNQALLQAFTSLDEEEEKKKSAILARVKSEN